MTQHRFNTSYIIAVSFISALGGYLFGFDFAVISGALPFLKKTFDLAEPWKEGLLTGSLALGCIAGCLIAGSLADKYGRRPGLMTAAIIFALSSIGMAVSNTLGVFIGMRLAAGIGVGMASMLSPMYIAEISPAAVRGRNVAINQLTIVFGILITNLVNYFLADTGVHAWRWMFGLGAVPSLFFLLGVLWLPESPRWLMQANQQERARQILGKIGNPEYAAHTVTDIKQSLQGAQPVSLAGIWSPSVRRFIIPGIMLAVFQQFCGINVVFNYTSTIFESVGANLNQQLFETVSIGAVNLLFTILAMWQVDKLGRKPLMLGGAAGLAVIYLVLALLLQNQAAAGLVSVFVLIGIALYATSLAPVTWVLIAEIFPNHIRARATTIAVLALWAAYFLLVFTYPILAKKLGTYVPFYIYAGVCALGFLFVRNRIQETKGKTLEEISGQSFH
ncbi:MFS transporter [Niastella yeongjuensis]|uniref:MFS transporter n=1 Tax=Niastella yeongjuensis TaxID=354355 RepID=A0A1V9DYF1_9BACT|nr:sugar porter family MFS transporter [Niastella yeongjuensis]OQP38829.1 MFS transporter [Niastella yeongjuensis]SEO30986.1 MFS transporter, sugar porter (SP) family [Niastella yeongjuensis]